MFDEIKIVTLIYFLEIKYCLQKYNNAPVKIDITNIITATSLSNEHYLQRTVSSLLLL